jgi:hypothetical protein
MYLRILRVTSNRFPTRQASYTGFINKAQEGGGRGCRASVGPTSNTRKLHSGPTIDRACARSIRVVIIKNIRMHGAAAW